MISLLIYAAWARGGIYQPLQWPLSMISLLLLGGFFFVDPGSGIIRRIFQDPVFSLGLMFLLLLTVQKFNSGYYLFQNDAGEIGMGNHLPSRWLPWSVDPLTAGQMLDWFLPAWAVIIIVRHGLTRSDIKLLLHAMVWNASLLAVVALLQKTVGVQKMLGLWTIPGKTFHGTFGYVNHAGAWFYLHAALAAGLAHRALRLRQPPVRAGVWALSFLLCLAAACSSLSRAAGLVSVALIAVACGSIIHWGHKRVKGKQLVNIAGLACIVVLFGAVLYSGSGKGSLSEEIQKTILETKESEVLADRIIQYPSAWNIAREYPLFGCGGWGYRWIALLYVPEGQEDIWRRDGKANVHCDPLQFLCEFGWVGTILMALVIGLLGAQGMHKGRAGSLKLWIGLGLFMVFLHSWVDLPFRCPAILLSWCALLAALPKLSKADAPEFEC